jgi:hypothetical protein
MGGDGMMPVPVNVKNLFPMDDRVPAHFQMGSSAYWVQFAERLCDLQTRPLQILHELRARDGVDAPVARRHILLVALSSEAFSARVRAVSYLLSEWFDRPPQSSLGAA